MNKILLTDIDEVLLDWSWSFENFLKKEKNLIFEHKLKNYYDFEKWSGKPFEEIWSYVDEFCSNKDYYRNIPVFQCAKEVLPELHKKGWDIIPISAAPNLEHVKENRKYNLENHFGYIFKKIHLTGDKNNTSKNCKIKTLCQYESTYFVEDSPSQLEKCLTTNHNIIIMDYEYNKHIKHNNRVKNWYEIYDILERK